MNTDDMIIMATDISIVEPPIGNIKENLGFREFLTRGINSVKTELNLVSMAHNLKKVWMKRKDRGVKNNISEVLRRLCGVEIRL